MSDNARLILELARYGRCWRNVECFSKAHAYEHSARMAARTLFGRELRLPTDNR